MEWLQEQPGNDRVSKDDIAQLISEHGRNLPDVIDKQLSVEYSSDLRSADDDQVYAAMAALAAERVDLTEQGSALEGMQDEFNLEIPGLLLDDPGLADVLEGLGEDVASVLQQSGARLDDQGRAYVESLVAQHIYQEIYYGLIEAMQEHGDATGAVLDHDEIRMLLKLPDAW